MEHNCIADKLKEIFVEVKNNTVDCNSIDESTDLINDIGIDSLQLINFILSIEDEFELEIDFDSFDITHLNRFQLLCKFIEDCIDQKAKESDMNEAVFTRLTSC